MTPQPVYPSPQYTDVHHNVQTNDPQIPCQDSLLFSLWITQPAPAFAAIALHRGNALWRSCRRPLPPMPSAAWQFYFGQGTGLTSLCAQRSRETGKRPRRSDADKWVSSDTTSPPSALVASPVMQLNLGICRSYSGAGQAASARHSSFLGRGAAQSLAEIALSVGVVACIVLNTSLSVFS